MNRSAASTVLSSKSLAVPNRDRPHFEVADVVRAYGDEYRKKNSLSYAQESVLENIIKCRTKELGGHKDKCQGGCGYERISYNSCRDRNCPKCQGSRRWDWVDGREKRQLPVPHLHVVFKLRDELDTLAMGNKKVVYDIFFKAVSKTLLKLARDPKHLGAEIGVTALLQTWAQNLEYHPHLHCIITAGGLSLDGSRWVKAKGFGPFTAELLSELFRSTFLALLDHAYEHGKLKLAGSTAELADPDRWKTFQDELYHTDWVVHIKLPFGGVQQIYRYVAKYVNRVAIDNDRIVDVFKERVKFTIRNYNDGGRTKTTTLHAFEFLRRFMLHVLPSGFVCSRHYGLYASRNVYTKLPAARRILELDTSASTTKAANKPVKAPKVETGIKFLDCPRCGGRLLRRPLRPSALTIPPNARATRAPPVRT